MFLNGVFLFHGLLFPQSQLKIAEGYLSLDGNSSFPGGHIFRNYSLTVRTTVIILIFWTDRSGQTVQTQIRLLLKEQSYQGLHCLLFNLSLFDKIPQGLAYRLEKSILASENLETLRYFVFSVALFQAFGCFVCFSVQVHR